MTHEIGGHNPLEKTSSRLSLESEVFQNPEEKKYLQEWAKANTNISVIFEERGAIENKYPNSILEKNGSSFKDMTGYSMHLPTDLKIKEIPKIIQILNTFTFGNTLPKYASLKEIEKYIKTYRKHFPNCHFELFSQFQDRIEVGDIAQCKHNTEKMKTIHAQEKNDPENNTQKLEEALSQNLKNHLYESFQEKGMKNMSEHMEGFTKNDWDKLSKEEQYKEGVLYKKTRNSFHDSSEKLKDILKIDALKIELEHIRKTGNKEKIEALEKKIITQINKEVHLFPRQDDIAETPGIEGTNPQPSIETKRLLCVGKTMLVGSFLQELGIDYKVMMIPFHIALLVKNKYYVDPTLQDNLIDISKSKISKIGISQSVKIKLEYTKKEYDMVFHLEEPEQGFFESQIGNQNAHHIQQVSEIIDTLYAEKNNDKEKYQEALDMLDRNIPQNIIDLMEKSKNFILTGNLGKIYGVKGRAYIFGHIDERKGYDYLEKSNAQYQKTLLHMPNRGSIAHLLGNNFLLQGMLLQHINTPEAVKKLEKAIEAYHYALTNMTPTQFEFVINEAIQNHIKNALLSKITTEIDVGNYYFKVGIKTQNNALLEKAILNYERAMKDIDRHIQSSQIPSTEKEKFEIDKKNLNQVILDIKTKLNTSILLR